MSDIALPGSIEPAARKGPDLTGAVNPLTGIIFGGIIAAVFLFVAYSIYSDIDAAGGKVTSYAPFLLLFVALLIALGFEFVNGFHDTANAVATVIYTRSLPANFAVIWSGCSICSGFWHPAAPSPSASFRCFRSNSSCKSAAAPDSPWSSRC